MILSYAFTLSMVTFSDLAARSKEITSWAETLIWYPEAAVAFNLINRSYSWALLQ